MAAMWTVVGIGADAAPDVRKPLPGAAVVLTNLLQRASQVATNKTEWTYTRRTVVEELDDKGRVKSTKYKTYEVTQVGGVTSSRLVAVFDKDGEPMDATEQARREEETKEELGRSRTSGKRGRYDQILTEELLARFHWSVSGRETIGGRQALMLMFRPRPDRAKDDKLLDRVVNRMAGTIWVDEDEWEIARVSMRLTERVTLWAGLLGALDKLEVAMDREPGAPGVWFVSRTHAVVHGRQLLNSMRLRANETSRDFKARLPAPNALSGAGH